MPGSRRCGKYWELRDMSLAAAFWVIAGFAAGIAASFVLLPVIRGSADESVSSDRRIWIGSAAALGLLGLAIAMYLQLGRPDSLDGSAASTPHTGVASSQEGQVGSMEASIQRLAEKLAEGGGSDAEWDLLAQSYDFMGNAEAASEARQHRVPGASQPVVQPASDLATYEQNVAGTPKDVESWLGIASLKRAQRDFAGAVAAYEQVRTLKGMTADSWADYADALASQPGGSLQGKSAEAIDQALKMDRNHPKALWLKATLAIQDKRFADATRLWKQLRGVLPAKSPDVRIIEANIAEAEALAKGGSAAQAAVAPSPAAAVEIAGTVDLDPALRSKVTPGMTLYIYAKVPNAAGPPLAVSKVVAGSWPARFVLDDSQSMLPDRRLSDFQQVVIEARLSKTGQAIAAAGDLQGRSGEINTRAAKPVNVKINQVIG
jgi:cytochrome c-type biogenesis protein CcmH